MSTIIENHYDCLRNKLGPWKLYVALQYPPNEAGVFVPEIHPELLGLRPGEAPREPEYVWSFMLTFIKDAKLWIKHYTVVGRLATPQFDFYLRAISILNTGLRKSLWNIETAYHESCRLDAIPRLAFLVEVQDLLNFEADRSSFETFLSKHRFDLDGWRMPYHSHPWAWDVLRMYEAINAKLGTVSQFEVLARATIKEHESECPSCLGLRTWVDWGFTDEEGDEDEDEDKENVDEDIDEEEECEGREGPVANLHDPASHKHNRISDANS